MALADLMTAEVVIVTPTYGDDNGDTVKLWDDAAESTEYVWITQRTATEALGNREQQVSGWFIVADLDAPLTADARVRFEGRTFEVVGHPKTARTPEGPHHIEAELREVTG